MHRHLELAMSTAVGVNSATCPDNPNNNRYMVEAAGVEVHGPTRSSSLLIFVESVSFIKRK
ncbi:hypothetical protein IEQ34_005585 [Dendrobium chrysotoxum]|uniref:Uncharacterized protein n=1 Tax=Dendrobium chrysotoxum TaxID=161865 RepID=A0AAV7HC85_DENCH|nr:hypothetical protein IEQ34_005585 [Dendrobium chrysotoxum]